jgi:uncharacterized protein (TIGR00369 family)
MLEPVGFHGEDPPAGSPLMTATAAFRCGSTCVILEPSIDLGAGGAQVRGKQPRAPRITAAAFEELAWQGVPFVGQLGCRIERFAAGEVAIRLPYSDLLLRPGGTICGPALMALADVTLYGVVLSVVGPVPLALTTSLNVHFLSRPAPRDVLAQGQLLKLGRRLAVGVVTMCSDGEELPICHATGTYAIPPPAA